MTRRDRKADWSMAMLVALAMPGLAKSLAEDQPRPAPPLPRTDPFDVAQPRTRRGKGERRRNRMDRWA